MFKYELFGTDTITFTNQLCMSIGCSGRLVPRAYRRLDYDYDEAIELAKYPTCGWSSDSYINWLTQNAVNIPANTALNLVGAGQNVQANSFNNSVALQKDANANINTVGQELNIAGNIAGNIANTIGAFYSASLLTNKQGGSNLGDINFSAGSNGFTFKFMRATNENMKIIDDFFTRFGYKINEVTTPNLTGRKTFNYVEIGASEFIGYGSVPANAMQNINNAFRRGVTIWHNHDNIGNYTLDNSIV